MLTNDMPTVPLWGSGAERGRIHGESLREEIRELVARLKESLGREYGVAPQKAISQFLQATDHVGRIQDAAPDLFDEVLGIAQGAHCPIDDIWAHNLIDELWCFGFKDRVSEWNGPFNKCSVIGIPADGRRPTIAGQNIDVSSWYDGYQVLLRVQGDEDNAGALVLSVAGVVGLAGINEFDVGVCINALFELEHRSAGLPVAVLVRSALGKRSIEAAKRYLCAARHASGQHYLLSDRERVISLECSANRAEIVNPAGGPIPMCHTNHVLRNSDTAKYEQLVAGLPPERRQDFLAGSHTRMETLEELLAAAGGRFSVDLVKSLLASTADERYPVSRDGGLDEEVSWMTLTSFVFEYSNSGPASVHIAAGPPHVSQYERFEFHANRPATNRPSTHDDES